MRTRSQPHHQHTRLRIAEPWHRLAPIFAVEVGPPLLPRHLLAILDQPRTSRALHNFMIENAQPVGDFRHA